MSRSKHRVRLTVKGIAAIRPRPKEHTLWDKQLAHFGVRVQPSGVKSYILQMRVRGRMRKITLGRFPELPLDAARREGAAVLARLWGGEDVKPPREKTAPLFRQFAARYRERRRHRWKPSTLETYDIYLRNRLIPPFGKLRLDAIDHARVSAWFDAASVDKPGAANRAFEILRAMLKAARQWGELGEHVPDACANIARNPRRPVARYLDHAELQRLGKALDRRREEHPWHAAAIRLLALTGARLSEILNLTWDEIDEGGASVRLEDSKTGPRTVWLGPEAANVLAGLPRDEASARVFPEDLTSTRLYSFWVGIREQAGLPGLRIHDCRHTWASQGVINGVGLTTVGRLLGHRQRETTAIYAHLDDCALRGAAARAAAVLAKAMGYRLELPPLPKEADGTPDGPESERSSAADWNTHCIHSLDPPKTASTSRRAGPLIRKDGPDLRTQRNNLDWLGSLPPHANTKSMALDSKPSRQENADGLGTAPIEPPSRTPPSHSTKRDRRRKRDLS